MSRLHMIQDPLMPGDPLLASPGFMGKDLATHHIDFMAKCRGGCAYCSSPAGAFSRINQERRTRLAVEQLGYLDLTFDEATKTARTTDGAVFKPTRRPDVAIRWDPAEYLRRLRDQLARLPRRGWGAGKLLVVSQLTDPLIGDRAYLEFVHMALKLILESIEDIELRMLTKSEGIAREPFLGLWKAHRDRVMLGLSIGTLDDDWARRVESGTSSPSARIRAHRALQDAGLRVYMMGCPIFPDVLVGDGVERLVTALRPERCIHSYAEPVNDRNFWEILRDSYEVGSFGHEWFTDVYERKNTPRWSAYATELYSRLRRLSEAGGWELRYLLYEGQITDADAPAYAGLHGVLLQSIQGEDDKSSNPAIAALQRDAAHGRAKLWRAKARRRPRAGEPPPVVAATPAVASPGEPAPVVSRPVPASPANLTLPFPTDVPPGLAE